MSGGHKTIQYQLRITEEMREKIRQSSVEHNRSMNQDIVARLEQSFAQPQPSSTDMNFFIGFLESFVEGSIVDPTSERLMQLVKAWKAQNKKD